jgi:hypothetical protein
MADSILSLPRSYNIENIKSIFNEKYTDFIRYNTLLTSSYVNKTPNEYYNHKCISENININEDLYTLGVLYKDDNDKEYDSQYTVTGSIKKFELNSSDKLCNSNQCKIFTSNDITKICTCVVINAAKREMEEEIGLSLKNDVDPIAIFEKKINNKQWFTLIFHISQCMEYQFNYFHKIILNNKNRYQDINKFKIQVVIIGSEKDLKDTLKTVNQFRIGRENDIIGVTLCNLKELKFEN